ncbi:hypothetical protein HMPREF9163_00564 [Selenomonas sp. oral taxon 138 str. F0429]|nr:hypothetical protein HMPREF9163_00564 [Selenomonas sp. oral taxon 138 str. F0429]
MNKDRPWKYQAMKDVMMRIHPEGEYNNTYLRENPYVSSI